MDLFTQSCDYPDNLLPRDGNVSYYGQVFSCAEADDYLSKLLQDIDWKRDEAVIYGRHITTRRKVAWYADKPFEYTYSNVTRRASHWNDILLSLKRQVQCLTGQSYNACLLNLYHDGSEGMGWHSDDEADLLKHSAIASLSLGAERKFSFKHKRCKERISLTLHHGSLLVMQGVTQAHWLHQLPTMKTVNSPRVNLTFRTMVE